MCKVCVSCHGIMNYDPYFEAEVCEKCGRIERKPSVNNQNDINLQTRGVDVLKQIMGVMMVN